MKQLKLRSDSVALLADQRMPRIDGVHFLQEAMRIYPRGQRALLTAYADTTAAIGAINQASIHYFFMKPPGPAQHRASFYPQLDDLLEDWQASHHPAYSGIRVPARAGRRARMKLRDFLARNHVPYHSGLTRKSPRAIRKPNFFWKVWGRKRPAFPSFFFPTERSFPNVHRRKWRKELGCGRARKRTSTILRLLAAVQRDSLPLCTPSEGLHTVIVEREAPGGQAGMSSRIENYLGFPAGLSGGDLARRAVVQAQRFGVEIIAAEASETRIEGHTASSSWPTAANFPATR